MTKFLEINGKNLKEFHTIEYDTTLNSSIAGFCPNLKKLHVVFMRDDIGIFRDIFSSCQYLERIKVMCGKKYLSEKEVLKIVAVYSPINFYELKILNTASYSELLPEDLEVFFINWKNRVPNKKFSLIVVKNCLYDMDANNDIMNVIEKYKNLGVIENYGNVDYDEYCGDF